MRRQLAAFAFMAAVSAYGSAVLAAGPVLPEGLEPSLPGGLGGKEAAGESAAAAAPGPAVGVSGYWEARAGARTRDDAFQRDMSIGETRLQLEAGRDWDALSASLTADLLYDPVSGDHGIHLEEGRGWLDLREANLAFSPAGFLDVKAGRQVITWGTGDLIFINDLFPKDWNSFFIGRDQEYLKAPSDALRVSLYGSAVNLDLAYMPRFDADRYIDGRAISFWNSALGRISGRDAPVEAEVPDEWFTDDEIAARLFGSAGQWETALYGYMGFWKSPGGLDPVSGRATFPELSVYGASARGPLGKGIANLEIGLYESGDDPGGSDPFVRNGEFRFLAGYEQEAAADFTIGVQYYLEHMQDHGSYLATLPPGQVPADEDRSVLTLRLTRLLMNQNLTLSLFIYYSPTERDAYLRPNVHYKVSDDWSVEAGGNIFAGKENHTFFGQFEGASNLYIGTRRGF